MPSPSPDQPFLWTYEYQKKVLSIINQWEAPDQELFLEDKVGGLRVDDIYRSMDISRIDPFEWVKAVQQEQQEWDDYHSRLVTEHGHPDTSCMSRERAYIVRLSFLMAKYPNSDWDTLLADPMSDSKEPSGLSKTTRPAALVPKEHPKELPKEHPKELPKEHPEELPESATQVAPTDVTLITHESGEPVSDDADTARPSPNMDVKEVALIIGMTEQTVRRFMAEGALPYAKKLRRNWVVPRGPFMEWFKGNDDSVRALSEPKPRPKRTPKEPEPARVHRHGRSASF